MGTTDSKQKLGERVIAAKKKLADDKKMQSERVQDIKSQSPETLKVIMDSVAESFKSCSPFLEPTLLMGFEANPNECEKIILDSCRKVLNAPIIKDEYEWFIKYVFPSSVWMYKTNKNRYMYEELIDIANDMSINIVNIMNSIYDHLKYHPKWQQLKTIKNQTIISRQDDSRVCLLKEKGITNFDEIKQTDDNKSSDDLQAFIDTNLAINMLTSTAKNINSEFQNHIKTVMSHYGDFKSGPIKKVDRCLSKLENDYSAEAFPKSAKLLDLVRCSVTFNTVDQLVDGYNALLAHISKNKSIIELARVKNGFLDDGYKGGYRDIKVNVIYHSSNDPDNNVSMICEIQLLLGQYLHEKKRIHKLYSIIRQQEYFKMTVLQPDDQKQMNSRDVKDLKFEPVLDVSKQVEGAADIPTDNGKCTVDSDLGVVGIESAKKMLCIDIKTKKIIFNMARKVTNEERYSHCWGVINGMKYLSVQYDRNTIKFFQINQSDYSFIEAKELEICLNKTDTINCCEFDAKFENIILVKNRNILEKRAVKRNKDVLISIKLEQSIQTSSVKTLSLSNDGNWCVIGGGGAKSYFYFIELNNKVQHKVISSNLKNTFTPCFVNGDPNFCVVRDAKQFEVWDVKKRTQIKLLETEAYILCTNSSSNILAIGSADGKFSLWDTERWEMFWSEKYEVKPLSVHLTADAQYITIGGKLGEKCIVLSIK